MMTNRVDKTFDVSVVDHGSGQEVLLLATKVIIQSTMNPEYPWRDTNGGDYLSADAARELGEKLLAASDAILRERT